MLRNGLPPRSRRLLMRASNTGSPGEANGILSINTQDNASPRTSTPSQKLLVPSKTALPCCRNSSSKVAFAPLPCPIAGK
jgi:hypothetical protein